MLKPFQLLYCISTHNTSHSDAEISGSISSDRVIVQTGTGRASA